MPFSSEERTVLRDLAKRVADIAAQPVMEKRRQLWKKHNSLQKVRPLVLVFPEGSWRELMPDDSVRCRDKEARNIERELRRRIFYHEHIHDDTVIENKWPVGKAIRDTGWGLEARWHKSNDPLGARTFDPVILQPSDLKKLRTPEIHHDAEASQARLAEFQELFGDILDVYQRGTTYTLHIMNHYTSLRGLEQVMMDMVAEPQMLHDAMAFYEQAHKKRLEQLLALNLLALNNDNSYQGTGGNGWTDDLPAPGFDPNHVRPCDVWAMAEAQEMAQVSPQMHEEFILSYERRLLAPFGLNNYGCCEDLTRKLGNVLSIPNIRRISIAPSANPARCAEQIGNRAVFSWKPQPAQLVGRFDTGLIRKYIAHTLDVTRDCVVEMVLKDTHTCEHKPERFTAWTDIATELIRERHPEIDECRF